VSLVKRKRFLVLFFKKEQKKQRLLFEKRSKNFCQSGARRAAGGWRAGGAGFII
jgi:hypothetical protein